ncbi:MAG TPA: cupredoxin domain-containing protein [Burkholderiales bacterium]|nr:cupredoxin domain-containing protein [Burkholderiales bacterium]
MGKRAPAVIAVVLGMAAAGGYFVAQSAQPKGRVIKVTTKRFTYDPPEIRLKKGEPVVLELTTADVPMGFNLPDFRTRADIVPGKTTRVRLVPDKTGSFIFLCDVFCGIGHEEMNGKVVVSE